MKTNQRFVNLTNVEDITPYNFSEYYLSSSKWVNFGENNDWPDYLRTLYLTSPTHQSIIDQTINLSLGEGVIVKEPELNPLSNKWLQDNFPKDVVKLMIQDLKIYGYTTIKVYGSGEICEYDEAIKYRFDKKDENGKVNYIWYSNDWSSYHSKKNKPTKLPIYKQGIDSDVSVMVIQLDKKGYDYYSPVDYNAGINWVNIESEIANYHLSNIKNGLFPSFVINVFGDEFSEEQMDMIENNINKKFGGSSNSGRAIVGFSANKDMATTIDTIEQANIDKTYEFLSNESSRKILLAHGVSSPLLMGIRDTGGGFGSNADELEKAFFIYYESKLKHIQNYILQGINVLMNGNLLFANLEFSTYNPFKSNEESTKLSEYQTHNEFETSKIVNKFEKLKVKIDKNYIELSEELFDNILDENSYYLPVICGKPKDLVSKKLELLSKNGYLLKGDNIIKNTKNYFFLKKKFIQKK